MTDPNPAGPTMLEIEAAEERGLASLDAGQANEASVRHALAGLRGDYSADAASDPVPTGPTLDHATYLGASDIGCVVGENHLSRDASDVWGEKMGHLHFEGNVATELGNAFERPMLKVWAADAGVEVAFPGTMLHPDEQWAGATADGNIVADEAVVEAKIVGFQMKFHWGPEVLDVEGVPASVVIQVHWQAWVLRANGIPITTGIVVACFGTEIRTYEFPIDDDLIDYLVEEGRAWWHHFVEGNVEPEGRAGRAIVLAIHPANVREILEAPTEEIVDLALAYDDARADEKEAKRAKEDIGVKICRIIGDGLGFYGDGIKTTWKANRGGKRSLRVDVKKGRA